MMGSAAKVLRAAGHWGLAALVAVSASASAQSRFRCENLLFAPGTPSAAQFSRFNEASGAGQTGVEYTDLRVVRLTGASALTEWGQTLTLGDYFLCSDSALGDAPALRAAPAPPVLTGREVRSLPFFYDYSVAPRWPRVVADALDAHAHSVWLRDWFRRALGLGSYDGIDAPFYVAVGEADPFFGAFYREAEYELGSLRGIVGIVSFTPPRGCTATPLWCSAEDGMASFAASLDIVAHEWGHGISSFHSGLGDEREPGALSEAFSDWVGAAADAARGRDDSDVWNLGEDARVVRNIRLPVLYGDPDTYQGLLWRETDPASCVPVADTDYCGIHINSGVGNRMFYLLSAGGTQHGVTVQGIGVETAIQLALAAQNYWLPQTGYVDAARGMQSAAVGFDPGVAAQVERAWQAVCVLDRSGGRCPNRSSLWADWVSVIVAVERREVDVSYVPSQLVAQQRALVSGNPGLDIVAVFAHADAAGPPLLGQRRMRVIRPLLDLSASAQLSVYVALQELSGGWLFEFAPFTPSARPVLQPMVSTGSDSVSLDFAADANGQLRFLALPADHLPVDLDGLLSHADVRSSDVTSGSNTATWAGLQPGMDYTVYASLQLLRFRRDVTATIDVTPPSASMASPAWTRYFFPLEDRESALFVRDVSLAPPAQPLPSPILAEASTGVMTRQTTLRWWLEANMRGQIHYLAATAPGMGAAAVFSHLDTRRLDAEAGANSVEWRGLADDTDYVLYAFLRTGANGESALVSASARTGQASLPPPLTPDAPPPRTVLAGGGGGGGCVAAAGRHGPGGGFWFLALLLALRAGWRAGAAGACAR